MWFIGYKYTNIIANTLTAVAEKLLTFVND
jgi:hypothetical protein